MMNWVENSVFYHIYPLGFTGAPERNTGGPAQDRLSSLRELIPRMKDLGVTALLLGPVFESESHGYDTTDYYKVDPRLGTNADLASLSRELGANGIRLVLDGVFNHTGRSFFAFRDILSNPENSPYTGWYHIRKNERSPYYNDPFNYQCWQGHYHLPRLNWGNPEVQKYFSDVIRNWKKEFGISGLRLDAADALDPVALEKIGETAASLGDDFWLMGEAIHGDYRRIARPGALHSATNYEAYKGLWSSLNDKNYFEIAYALKRQSGSEGIYRGLSLYNFSENHDVDRAASLLKTPEKLFPLYGLLFTMPGIPGIYYGGEYGVRGERTKTSDKALRPSLDYASLEDRPPVPGLKEAIRRFAWLRRETPVLCVGDYRELLVTHEQLAFSRATEHQTAICAWNASDNPVTVTIPSAENGVYDDRLNPGESFTALSGKLILPLYPHWGRVLCR